MTVSQIRGAVKRLHYAWIIAAITFLVLPPGNSFSCRQWRRSPFEAFLFSGLLLLAAAVMVLFIGNSGQEPETAPAALRAA